MLLLELGALCSDAELVDGPSGLQIAGSPTETALIQAALDLRLHVPDARLRRPRQAVRHRTEGRRYMATTHGIAPGRTMTAVKGTPHARSEERPVGKESVSPRRSRW